MTRNEKILKLRGVMSFSLIAERFGVSRSVVAGVMFRARWDRRDLVKSNPANRGGANKCGLGYHGPGAPAERVRESRRRVSA
jgi:hypothetical protein